MVVTFILTGSGAHQRSIKQSLVFEPNRHDHLLRNRRNLKILVEDDPRLFNQYSVILVNPAWHPSGKGRYGHGVHRLAHLEAGQAKIASYKVEGQQLFFPDYRKP